MPGQGPLRTVCLPEEARHAMETAQERNLEWETDPKWHDRDTPPDPEA